MNKKGYVVIPAVLTFQIGFALVTGACLWHIPERTSAKANGTVQAMQQKEMWPQQLFDKLPGGTVGRLNAVRVPQPTDNGEYMR